MNLALTTRIDGDVAILHCGGDIVLGNEAAALCDTLLNLVREYRYIIVNLSSVRSVDGRGLGTLAECIDISRRKGSQIVFCNVPRRVRQLLDLTRLSSQVEIAATETDALEASRAAA